MDIVHGFNILRLELLNAICFADESRMADCLPECTTLQRTEIVQVTLIAAFAFISRASTAAYDHILIFTEHTQFTLKLNFVLLTSPCRRFSMIYCLRLALWSFCVAAHGRYHEEM